MLKNFTLGQYYSVDSVVHRLDPRFKLVEMILCLALIFLTPNFLVLFLVSIFYLGILLLSKVPLTTYLRNLKPILPIIIFTALLNALYINEGTLLFSWWVIRVTTGGLIRAAFMSFRIVLLVLISSVLTYTTTPTALTDGIESLFSPLKYLGLGEYVHTLAMMMTIALRFIPTLVEEAQKIMAAQKARGADLETGGLIKRLKALMPILIPLLISSVRRAYELAEAMECRCYCGGKGRTHMKRLIPAARDYYSAGAVLLLFTAVLLLRIAG